MFFLKVLHTIYCHLIIVTGNFTAIAANRLKHPLDDIDIGTLGPFAYRSGDSWHAQHKREDEQQHPYPFGSISNEIAPFIFHSISD